MALFTDGLISSVQELLGYESAILDVAKTESIDLTTKLKLAEEELTVELQAFLARQDEVRGVGNIVVTEALHKWHTFRALAIAFRDAYYRQLNDRYQRKWQEYERLASWALKALLEAGVAMTNAPVPRAQAPELTTVAGSLSGATYFVSVTWIGPGGREGAPSDPAAITTADGTLLSVSAVNPPAGATGWNVYVGHTGDNLTLQNGTPLAATETWAEPDGGLIKGRGIGNGQAPDTFLRQSSRRVVDRG